jgi:acyl-CoA synthetase (AMP-forming)/AMP-acid ligase II
LKGIRPVTCTVQKSALEYNSEVPVSIESKDTRTLVGSGRSWLDQRIIIVDPETFTQCSSDQIGEVWIVGPNVSQGYWNLPEETESTFRGYLNTGEGPFLRTGDLGFLQKDELFITGRIKDLIIIAGHNFYPHDIEYIVERSHPAIRTGCSAAFSVEAAGQERLVVVAEVSRKYKCTKGQAQLNQESDQEGRLLLEEDLVVKAIRQSVMEYVGLPVYEVQLLKAGTLPKTSSGKVQRRSCRSGFLNSRLKMWNEDDTYAR